jgi:methyl-accepting chemotaxis protein
VTQQNAALVEEATAASSSLAMEAEKLRQIVSQFRLDGGRVSAPAQRGMASAPAPASARHAPAPSPARKLVSKIAKAVGGGGGSAAPAESWEEF